MNTNKTLLDLAPIRTELEYEHALAEIELLFEAEPGTPEVDYLEVLSILVEAYEEKNYRISAPDPIAAILFRMESIGLTRKDLEPFIGSRGRVSEVLNKKRPLTIGMIRSIERGLGIPADVLIQPYSLDEIEDPAQSTQYNIYIHFTEYIADVLSDDDFTLETQHILRQSMSKECYYPANLVSSSSPINISTYGDAFSSNQNDTIPFKHQQYIMKNLPRPENHCLSDFWIDAAEKSSTHEEIIL